MKLKKKHLAEYLDFAIKAVKRSEDITVKYFDGKIKHKVKKNNTPVTIADLKCEDHLLRKIKKKFPGHSIYSEERGVKDKSSEFRWFIDPIDGTKNFMRGIPFWGTLLALEYQGEIVMGVISMPAVNEFVYAAKDMGCIYNDKKAKVSKIKKLPETYLIHGGLEYITKQYYRENFFDLAGTAYYSRGFGDCHGHSFIINGRADVMFDPFVSPYDVAPIKICIEEAGGMFTDINGDKTIYGGNAVVTNGRLHDEVLKILNHNIESRESLKLS